jgi:hypothetical protein
MVERICEELEGKKLAFTATKQSQIRRENSQMYKESYEK